MTGGIPWKNNNEKLSVFNAFFNVFYMFSDVFIIKNTVNKPFGEEKGGKTMDEFQKRGFVNSEQTDTDIN